MISKFTRHLGPKCRGDHSPRIRFPILVACCTSPRMEILSVPRLVVFGCSYPFTQDIGPGLSFYAIGAQGKIGPHNSPSKSCFSSPREKRRILILSSDLLYDLTLLSQIIAARVFPLAIRSWLFSVQGAPSFNFGNPPVSHVQRWDANPTVVGPFGNLGGWTPAFNFCATISSLSNQFLVTFERLRYSRTWYFISFSRSFARLQIHKSCLRTISRTCKSS